MPSDARVRSCLNTDAVLISHTRGQQLVLTINDICRILKCSPTTIYRLIKAGKLRAHRLGDGPSASLRVDEDSLREYIEAHTVSGPSAASEVA